ncbi:MAG TPA: sucrase ferredoxin [Actinomycetota bacterium]|nr:sucrase ferredoxin [Actinomycetota bacterium]
MRADRPACSTLSLGGGEPLLGTASRYRWWLMVEQPGRWGHDALVDSELPEEVGARLAGLADGLGMRVLLIKQRDRPAGAPRRCFVAYTGRQEQRLATFEVEEPSELLAMDLRALARRRFRGAGRSVRGPLFLVCTHGKHDPCCARLGLPLFRALADARGAAVWEATHVGGDRFAGNLVCFPHGVYFGRLSPEAAPAVARGYAEGGIDLRFYRGRSCYPPPIQAAEHFLRRHLDLRGIEDVAVRSHEQRPGNRHLTGWDTPSGRWVVDVEVVRRPDQMLTCKADHPGHPRGFELRGIAAAPDRGVPARPSR